MKKPYTLFTGTNHYAYSGVFTEAVESPDNLRHIAYISGSLSDMQQRWSATERSFCSPSVHPEI